MRKLVSFALAAVAVAAIAPAQTLALATGGANQGNPGGGIYFNVTFNATTTLTSIDYVASPASAAGLSSFNMFVGPGTWVGNVAVNPGVWTLVGATTPVTQPGGVATPINGVLNPAGVNPGTITFVPGTYGIALQAVGHSWRYTTAGTTVFSNADLTATLGGASNAFLTLPTFTPRVLNGALNYTLGGTPMPFAQRQPYGDGCYALYQSFYEIFPNTAAGFDLSNTSMYMTFDGAGNRYSSIVAGTTAPVAPISASLGHVDDNNIIINLEPIAIPQPILYPNIGGPGIAFTSVEMCSNLYLNLQGTTAAISNPALADWLNGTAVRLGNHHDADPGVGGTTHYDYDVVNAQHRFTWQGVPDFNIAGSSNTFQIVVFANSDVEFRWGAMSLLGGGGWPTLVGFSPGAGSLDPGQIDLSVAISSLPPLSTDGLDRNPLTLAADVNPLLGSTVTLTTSNPTGVSVGVCFIGVADLPGFSPTGLDLGFLGAPGCVANVNINPSASPLIENITPAMSVAFPIPLAPISLIGQSFFCQSIWVDPLGQNSFFSPGTGLLSSNAVRLKLGVF